MDPGPARAAVERTAQAVMSGNLAQLMSDITPEALAQMMQLGASAGALSPTSMPSIEGYQIEEAPAEGDAEVFHVSFSSSVGKATLATSWKPILGQWKVTAVRLVSAEPAPPEPGA
jgi:hypothetical protein